jgi:hypothetical protein
MEINPSFAHIQDIDPITGEKVFFQALATRVSVVETEDGLVEVETIDSDSEKLSEIYSQWQAQKQAELAALTQAQREALPWWRKLFN